MFFYCLLLPVITALSFHYVVFGCWFPKKKNNISIFSVFDYRGKQDDKIETFWSGFSPSFRSLVLQIINSRSYIFGTFIRATPDEH